MRKQNKRNIKKNRKNLKQKHKTFVNKIVNAMKTHSDVVVSFKSPKVESIKKVFDGDKLNTLVVDLDWMEMGKGQHKVYKIDDQYFWTDNEHPMPIRSFNSVEALAWEYHLPTELTSLINKL